MAIDLSLTEEQQHIQDAVRSFVDERVLPVAVQNDMEHKLDMSLIDGMRDLGILGAPIPTEWGGAGLDFISEALICEEIERGEAALRTLISVHVGLNSLSLLGNANDEQKERWLRPQATGEKIACFGLTEPDAGSDVAAMKTTAIKQGDGSYVLNGEKSWISFGTTADHALVFAKTDPAAAHKGISAFVVDLKNDDGVSTQLYNHKLGVWAGDTSSLFFSDVRLPADRLIGAEGEGFKIAMYSLDHGRFTVAAGAVGVIRACLEASTKYANERETMGKKIGTHQFVQDFIAQMAADYEMSRLLVWKAAWAKNAGVRNTRETSLAKWIATEAAFRSAHNALQIHGAMGFDEETGIARFFRNSRAPIIYEGTTQIHKMMQAEHALGWRELNGKGAPADLHRALASTPA